MGSKPSARKIESIVGGKYKVEKVIGEGGFSLVLKARDLVSNDLVAIKKLDITKKSNVMFKVEAANRKVRAMMIKEANIMRSLDHINLIKLYDIFIDEENIFIVLEYAAGGELFSHILKRGHFSEDDSVVVLRQIISGIKYMHSMGFVHRDIKAENILFLTKMHDSKILITDFGLTRTKEDVMFTNCGTILYLAPELILNKTTRNGYTYKVDIWSIGVLAYFLLSGNVPFSSRKRDHIEIKNQILSGSYSFSGREWTNVSSEARHFISCLLDRNPVSRLELEEAEEHPWLSIKKEGTTNSSPGVYPLMRETLERSLALQRWKVLIFVGVTILYLSKDCLQVYTINY